VRRLLVWRCALDTLRNSHQRYFPNGRFGSDLQILMVLGAVIASHTERKRASTAKLAHYLDMPPETTRRYLSRLIDLGLVERVHGQYWPTPRVASTDHLMRAVTLIKRTAQAL